MHPFALLVKQFLLPLDKQVGYNQSMFENKFPFTDDDIAYLAERGIAPDEAQRQYNLLSEGVSYPQIEASASLKRGVMRISDTEKGYYLSLWEDYRSSTSASVVRFVPASGAASRMFQMLFPVLELVYDNSNGESLFTNEQKRFFEDVDEFAFFMDLNESCLRNEWTSVARLISSGKYATVIQNLLLSKGLDYANLPKGLIPFHNYPNGVVRSAAMEHLAESAMIGKDIRGKVSVHFTLPENSKEKFIDHLERHKGELEDTYGVIYNLSYSTQLSSSDTIAIDSSGNVARDNNGTILLRPGGHGALLRNLSALSEMYDIAFIKNIDNVLPDYLKGCSVATQKLLGGILLAVQQRVNHYLKRIADSKVSHSLMEEMLVFLKETFCIELQISELGGEKDTIERIYNKLNRPIRVCGMVQNQGEPGGGPFIVKEADGSTSLQIIERSQIKKDDDSQKIFSSGAYFNPVLLVCSLHDYKGNKFELSDYANPKMAFLSEKSYEGKTIKALEHPGLWNGAMDRWNTIFVEVPPCTFSPVKTVLDLLRPEHTMVHTKTD